MQTNQHPVVAAMTCHEHQRGAKGCGNAHAAAFNGVFTLI